MKHIFTAAALLLATTSFSNAATLVNGSFEDPGTYSGPFVPLNAGNTAITGWTINSGSVDLINTYWQSADGNYNLDMSGTSAGSISQTVTGLTVGSFYTVFFDLAGNPGGGNVVKTITASLGNVFTGDFTFNTAGFNRNDMGWLTKSFVFKADAPTGLLTFTSKENNSTGPALDNVRISGNPSPVPVPAAGGLMALGLGLLGFMRRRKAAAV